MTGLTGKAAQAAGQVSSVYSAVTNLQTVAENAVSALTEMGAIPSAQNVQAVLDAVKESAEVIKAEAQAYSEANSLDGA